MHKTQIEDTSFYHNGDFSGPLMILLPKTNVEPAMDIDGKEQVFAEVSFSAVRGIVLEYLKAKLVGHLENISYDDFEKSLILAAVGSGSALAASIVDD